MPAFDFPNSPSNGQTYSANGIDWIYNGSVWKKEATSGVKGQKGEVGQKGQKGEVGEKGVKGEVGDKGQKGEIGATGGTGGTGTKGQKGEVGATGAAASKGQKGEIGSTGGTGGTGLKGQKGEAGAAASKGQKGEVGATGSGGSTGSTGQKGEPGAGGSNGSNGSDGDKGQKGEIGSITAAIPSGGIIIWSGSSGAIPSGWYLCDGNNSTPDLRARFVVGAGNGYAVGNTGGSDSVTLSSSQMPTHFHNVWTRNESAIDGSRGTSNANTADHHWTNGSGYRQAHRGGTYYAPTSNNQGGSGSHENRPPYYALCYIMKS